MKKKVGLIISLIAITIGLIFSLQVNAETGDDGMPESLLVLPYSQVITLQTGWNIVSTPRLVETHQFSIPETSNNFSIYTLDGNNNWVTMQDLGQTEFTPLFGYFILNKTSSTQTLTFNYKQDIDPAQRLFDRQLTPGWNVIGVANPSYALRQSDTYGNGYANSILGSTKSCLSSVIDFTSGNTDKTSVKVSGSWNNRNIDDLNSLNDWRDTKAYGVYANSGCSYHGTQNETSTSIIIPGAGTVSLIKSPWPGDQNVYANTSSTVLIGSFDVTAGNEAIRITGIDIGLASSTLDFTSSTSLLSWRLGKDSDNPAVIINPQANNYFSSDIPLDSNVSVGIDIYLNISNLKPEDIGKIVVASMRVTAQVVDSGASINSEIVVGQISTIVETPPPTLNISFNNYNNGGYLIGGSLVNGLLNYNINSPDDSVSIKQLYFKVGSSNPNFSAFSTVSVNNNNDPWGGSWLGGSLISTTTVTTTISLNELNIARNNGASISVGGQLSNIGSTANPSGIETSISLVGVRFIDSAGKSHEQYFSDDVYKSPMYIAVATRPYIGLQMVSNSLVLGTSKIARININSDSGGNGVGSIRIKSLPLRIITSNVIFNTSTNSLVVKKSNGEIINTTNTSCMSGDCVINFVEPYLFDNQMNYDHRDLDVYIKDVNYTNEQPGGLSAVTVSLGNKNLFIWDDVKGNLNDIVGIYDNSWPTNTVTTLRSDSEPPISEVVLTINIDNWRLDRYILSGREENLSYFSTYSNKNISIKQVIFKINNDSGFLPTSVLTSRLSGSIVNVSEVIDSLVVLDISQDSFTTHKDFNLRGFFVNTNDQEFDLLEKAFSISLIGIKYIDEDNNLYEHSYEEAEFKTRNFLVVDSKPNLSINNIESFLNIGSSGVAEIISGTISSNRSEDKEIRIKSLPINISHSDNISFNKGVNSLVLKNRHLIINTTNTSCESGSCVINFIDPLEVDNYYVNYLSLHIDDVAGEGVGFVNVSLGDKSLFVWDDIAGGLENISGDYFSDWPNNSISVIKTDYLPVSLELIPLEISTSTDYGYGDEAELAKFKIAFNTSTPQRTVKVESIVLKNNSLDNLSNIISGLYIESNGIKYNGSIVNDDYIAFNFLSGSYPYNKLEINEDTIFTVRGNVIGDGNVSLFLNRREDLVVREKITNFRADYTHNHNILVGDAIFVIDGFVSVSKKATSPSDTSVVASTPGTLALLANIKADQAINADGLKVQYSVTDLTSFGNVKVYVNNVLLGSFDPATTTAATSYTVDSSLSLKKGDNEVKVTVDVKSAASSSATFKANLVGASGALLDMPEYVANGNTVATSDISGSANGALLTVDAGSLTFIRNDGYANDRPVVQNTSEPVTLAKFAIKANNDAIRINNITLGANGASGTKITDGYISDMELYVDGVKLGTTRNFSGGATFSSLNYQIAKDATKVLELRGSFGSATGTFETLVTLNAQNSAGRAIEPKTASTTRISVVESGNLAGEALTTPSATILVSSSGEQEVAKYRLTATRDSARVTEITLSNVGTTTPTSTVVTDPRIASYKMYVGTTLVGQATPIEGVATFAISGNNLVVDANTNKTIVVKAVLNPITVEAETNKPLTLRLTEVKAKDSSGSDVSTISYATVRNSQTMYIRSAKPVLAKGTTVRGQGDQEEVARFTITAQGGDIQVVSTTFTTVGTGAASTSDFRLIRLDTGETVATSSNAAFANFELNIEAGETVTMVVRANTASVANELTFGLSLSDVAATNGIEWNEYFIESTSQWVGGYDSSHLWEIPLSFGVVKY